MSSWDKFNKKMTGDERNAHHEPMEQSGRPAQKDDPELDAKIDEEIEDMEVMQDEIQLEGKSVAELKDEVLALKDELQMSHDKLLRAHAQMDNIQRRARIDVENAHKYGIEKFVAALLPVVDSLEKAIETAAKGHDFEGVELTLKMLLDELQKKGVTQVNPVHEPFDPHLHEAISAIPNPEVEPNTILDVLQKGYTLSGRVIRPALVIVSK